MRLHWMGLRGFTRFKEMVELDFDAIGPGVIAFVAENGMGKTTILEASGPGFLFREMPTRTPPSLAASARPDGGRLVVDFSLGEQRYMADLKVKGSSQSATLLRGEDPVVSGKVRDYDAWVAQNVGPREAIYASVYGMQGGGGRFGVMVVRDRKGLFRYYLGLDRIERLHEGARARLSSLDSTLSRKQEVAEQLVAMKDRQVEADKRVVALGQECKGADTGLKAAQQEYETASQEATGAAMVAQHRAAVARLDQGRRRLESQRKTLAGLAVEGAPAEDIEVLRAAFNEYSLLQDTARRAEVDLAQKDANARRCSEAFEQAVHDIERADKVPCEKLVCGKCGRKVGPLDCPYLEGACKARTLKERLFSAREAAQKDLKYARKMRDETQGALELASQGDPAGRLSHAERTVAEYGYKVMERKRLVAEVARLEGEAKQAEREVSELAGQLPSETSAVDLSLAREKLRQAEARHVRLQREHAGAEADLKSTGERVRALEDESARLAAAAADVEPLRLLTKALGPDGVQAFEIDAAGPRVSSLTNDLLEACYGPRFSVQVVTQRELKSKEGLAEDFALKVLDAERGTEVDVGSLSGGERVVVDEAIGLALSLFANERLARPFATMWRDEPSAALDSENQRRYLRMCERARDLGGFHQILLATHSATIAEGAAVRIEIARDGTVTVRR